MQYHRRSARMILIDGAERILLFRGYLYPDDRNASAWFTPGGGVDDGESLAAAASRELREETGLAVPPERLGRVVAWTSGYADLGFASGWFRDDFFLHRVDRHEVDTSGFEALERGMIVEHRWWPLSDLAGTEETVFPLGLAPLVARLLAGAVPDEPVVLSWHH